MHSSKPTEPPKIGRPKGESFIFQASIFRCQLAVGFRKGDSPPSQSNKKNLHFDTVDGRNPAITTWDVSNPVNDGRSQLPFPQLVDFLNFFQPSTVSLGPRRPGRFKCSTPSRWSSIELPPHPNLRGHHQGTFLGSGIPT